MRNNEENLVKVTNQHFEKPDWEVMLASRRLEKAVNELNNIDNGKTEYRGLISYTRDQLIKDLPSYFINYKSNSFEYKGKQNKKAPSILDIKFHKAMLAGYKSQVEEYRQVLDDKIDYSHQEQFYHHKDELKTKIEKAENSIKHHREELRKAEISVEKQKKEWEQMFPGLHDIIQKHGFTKKSFDLWERINS